MCFDAVVAVSLFFFCCSFSATTRGLMHENMQLNKMHILSRTCYNSFVTIESVHLMRNNNNYKCIIAAYVLFMRHTKFKTKADEPCK